jgi:hypothetical protein
MALTILRPVTVKAIVTEPLKSQLQAELSTAIEQAERRLQHLEFQGKRMLLDLERKHPERLPEAKHQLEAKRQEGQAAKQELLQKLAVVEALQPGQEVVHSTAQGIWTVAVGQRWSEVQAAEIVIKDDVVVEIRQSLGS